MLLLAFIGLVFVAPNIRQSSIANQISFELRKHIEHRYDNDFSYEFLDSIQEEYQCCDQIWYRTTGFSQQLPMSCLDNLSIAHEQVSVCPSEQPTSA